MGWKLKLESPDIEILFSFYDPVDGPCNGKWHLERVRKHDSSHGELKPSLQACHQNKQDTRWTIPRVSCCEETPDSRKESMHAWGMECKWCFCGYPFISNISRARERKKERAVEEKRVREIEREWDRGVICLFPCYLLLPLCHITFKYSACAHFILKGSIWNHNGPSV